jgi:hypothetical protein
MEDTAPLADVNPITPSGGNGTDAATALAPAGPQPIRAEGADGILDGEQLGGSDDADTWLLTLAICIPIAAAVSVVMTYSLTLDPYRAFAIGAAVAVVNTLLLLGIYHGGQFDRAQHASVDTYNELCQRMDRVLRIEATPHSDDAVRTAQQRAAQSVTARGEAFKAARKKLGIHWILSKGYLDLLGIVHRAEEDVLLYEPLEQLLDDALADRARLTGSQVSGRDDLLNRLRRGLGVLSPTSVNYLPQEPPAAPDMANPPDAPPLQPDMEARVILRDVRYQIHTFRDDHRSSLIQVRDDVITTLFLTGLATVLLLMLLLIGNPTKTTLLGGSVLYVLGMIVGLFIHLSVAPNLGTRQEDYGLSTVALFQIAALSGIAAVLGAYVGVTFPAVMDVNKVTSTGLGPIPSPDLVYDLANHPVTIIFALIFAVTPRLLVQRLAAGVTQTKQELQSSSAGS